MLEHLMVDQCQDCGSTETPDPLRKCGLCGIDQDFLVYLQFGPGVDRAVRLQIERQIKRLLRPPAYLDYESPYKSSRKRRRRDDGCSDDEYSSGINSHSNRRRLVSRGNVGGGENDVADAEANIVGSAVVFYGHDTGYDIDATGDNGVDEVPRYERGTNTIVGLSSDSAQALGNPCFNCSMLGHELRSCPMPLDRNSVEANRNAFRDKGQGQFNSRLFIAVDEEKHADNMRRRFRPGQPLSCELKEALGLEQDDDVPEYVQSIYFHGYPPAYLGSAPDQDPLLVRDRTAVKAPATPELRVFSEDMDYADEVVGDTNQVSCKPVVDVTDGELDADDKSSIEDGALSEDEADSDPNKQSALDDYAECVRNIPLVKYPGLDLAQFDFTSTSCPGKPLHPHTPHRSKPSGESNYRYYGEPQDYSYQSSSQTPRATQGSYDDQWSGMLDDYQQSLHSDRGAAAITARHQAGTDACSLAYETSRRAYSYRQLNAAPRFDGNGYGYGRQVSGYDTYMPSSHSAPQQQLPPTHLPPPPLSLLPVTPAPDTAAGGLLLSEASGAVELDKRLIEHESGAAGKCDADFEDGECDMEESD